MPSSIQASAFRARGRRPPRASKWPSIDLLVVPHSDHLVWSSRVDLRPVPISVADRPGAWSRLATSGSSTAKALMHSSGSVVDRGSCKAGRDRRNSGPAQN